MLATDYLRVTGVYLPELNHSDAEMWAGWLTLKPWSDATTPRTDKPVRFAWRWHVGGISGNGTCWISLNRSGFHGWRKAWTA